MHFLELGDLIVERLKDRIDGVQVLTAQDLSGVQEQGQPERSIQVLYQGYRIGGPGGEATSGAFRLYTQHWLVVVAVRNARGGRTGSGVRADAGPLIDQVLRTLMGWDPGEGSSELHWISAPAAVHRPVASYYPLGFEATRAAKAA